MTGEAFGKVLGVSPMSVSRWENGDNEPPGECYAKMGNISISPNTRLYFWHRAGVDINVLSNTPIPSGWHEGMPDRRKTAVGETPGHGAHRPPSSEVKPPYLMKKQQKEQQ